MIDVFLASLPPHEGQFGKVFPDSMKIDSLCPRGLHFPVYVPVCWHVSLFFGM